MAGRDSAVLPAGVRRSRAAAGRGGRPPCGRGARASAPAASFRELARGPREGTSAPQTFPVMSPDPQTSRNEHAAEVSRSLRRPGAAPGPLGPSERRLGARSRSYRERVGTSGDPPPRICSPTSRRGFLGPFTGAFWALLGAPGSSQAHVVAPPMLVGSRLLRHKDVEAASFSSARASGGPPRDLGPPIDESG